MTKQIVTKQNVLTLKPIKWIQDQLPALDKTEFAGMVEDIKVNGLNDPIKVWNGDGREVAVIADGEHRKKACIAAGLTEAKYEFVTGPRTEQELFVWVCSLALHRRNLTSIAKQALRASWISAKEELALAKKKAEAEKARLETAQGGVPSGRGERKSGSDSDDVVLSNEEKGEIHDEAAEEFGVTRKTIETDKVIAKALNKLPAQAQRDIRAGKPVQFEDREKPTKVSVHALREIGAKTFKTKAHAMRALSAAIDRIRESERDNKRASTTSVLKKLYDLGQTITISDDPTEFTISKADLNEYMRKVGNCKTVKEAQYLMEGILFHRSPYQQKRQDEIEEKLWSAPVSCIIYDTDTIPEMAEKIHTWFDQWDRLVRLPDLLKAIQGLIDNPPAK